MVVLILALALGLGLGLGLRHPQGGGESPPTSSPSSTSTPLSPPTSVWKPTSGLSWQIDLTDTLDIDKNDPVVTPNVDVFDIDMFLHQNNSVVESLHKLGKRVVCYFSAGSYEPYRPDSYKFDKADFGDALDGWPDEHWLNISSPSVRAIMASRIEIAHKMGCDAIDPDNVDGYQNDNGLDLTSVEAIDFMTFLAKKAGGLKLAIGLKNAGDIVTDVLPLVQFAVNEQCAQYESCDTFSAFIKANKPVFHIEYPSDAPTISATESRSACSAPGTSKFSTVLKTMDLTGWVEYCDGHTASTDVVS
ncbi:glycoside hydrolase superfamily [Bombardia bombarda]|uniref:alpha-galactosidase n=1 Tax=Bombardia bombarda TaxID=252184 RepID=A0AA39WGQ9_9PEZI|nr:glycoside hydrolase superfamily [Bombardia bombarda]